MSVPDYRTEFIAKHATQIFTTAVALGAALAEEFSMDMVDSFAELSLQIAQRYATITESEEYQELVRSLI